MKTIYYDENYLAHYGVKGMKWGVRHDPERTGRTRRAGSLKGKLYRLAAANAGLNSRFGNKTMRSMQRAERAKYLKKAAAADRAAMRAEGRREDNASYKYNKSGESGFKGAARAASSSSKFKKGAKIAGGVLAAAGGVAVGAALVKSGKAGKLVSIGKNIGKNTLGKAKGVKISDIANSVKKSPSVHNILSNTSYGAKSVGKAARRGVKAVPGAARSAGSAAKSAASKGAGAVKGAAGKGVGAAKSGASRVGNSRAVGAARNAASNGASRVSGAAERVATSRQERPLVMREIQQRTLIVRPEMKLEE